MLAGNLGGVTSALLASSDAAAAAAAAARLDVLYPLRGATRCAPPGAPFEFTYPSSWLADYTVAERRAAAGQRQRALDPGAPLSGRRPRVVAEPDAAFGPPGSSGETNVSVIVAPIDDGFT